MALVSISEAARLVGKSRRTIQRDIVAGQLHKCDNGKKLDTSELLRVYGAFSDATNVTDVAASMTHLVTDNAQTNVADMRVRLAALEAENAALKDHLGSLKQAMLLLENKVSAEQVKPRRKWWQIFKNGN